MVHALPSPPEDGPASPRRSVPAILLSVSALLAILTKKATQVSKKLRPHLNHKNSKHRFYYYDASQVVEPVKSPATPRSPFTRRPKELFTNMSNKAIKFVHGRKKGAGAKEDEDEDEDFGDGGVWQRAILMGDKCQPLDFSGVIYYDENGRKLNELPIRSPRASPMPGYLARRNC
ncbi:uncharacterized protein LOC116212993 [Punica granatum]|uniref:Uncharacterized protein n=2 Tax=Punica granatum TaxID=22663 RepID=A0A218VZ56_PUNGR|nr:uncharacterized protein LOC116212993 [Punica granatum]OWM65162.1 hypothetical protein CDL15_Pgr008749 [Punica granatum]PKI43893.1 hypothetical protein CRG98_035727 [Punica granatum]